MNGFNFNSLFAAFANLPPLAQTDPRQSCIARTQIIGSLLHTQGIVVGRAWILPVYENDSFHAPFYDANGKPLQWTGGANGKAQPIKWRYHCATILPELPEQPLIDFPLFSAPVRLADWQAIFTEAQQRCTPRGSPSCELRVVTHAFADIPQRQVLRYHPQAEKHNRLLSLHRIAKLAMLPRRSVIPSIPFVPHKGRYAWR